MKICTVQFEIAHLTKTQKNRKLNKKSQSTDMNTEMNQMLELSDKNFKVPIRKNAPIKQLQCIWKQMKKQVRREIEVKGKNQRGIIELKDNRNV